MSDVEEGREKTDEKEGERKGKIKVRVSPLVTYLAYEARSS